MGVQSVWTQIEGIRVVLTLSWVWGRVESVGSHTGAFCLFLCPFPVFAADSAIIGPS